MGELRWTHKRVPDQLSHSCQENQYLGIAGGSEEYRGEPLGWAIRWVDLLRGPHVQEGNRWTVASLTRSCGAPLMHTIGTCFA
jgi:hypothetical protein